MNAREKKIEREGGKMATEEGKKKHPKNEREEKEKEKDDRMKDKAGKAGKAVVKGRGKF